MQADVLGDAAELRLREAVILPQLRWPTGATQLEDGSVALTDHVHMRRAVIVRVDHDAQGAELVNGGHADNLIGWVMRCKDSSRTAGKGVSHGRLLLERPASTWPQPLSLQPGSSRGVNPRRFWATRWRLSHRWRPKGLGQKGQIRPETRADAGFPAESAMADNPIYGKYQSLWIPGAPFMRRLSLIQLDRKQSRILEA